MERMDSFCGLYCGACEIFLARRKGLLGELAEKWGREKSEILCHGCKTEIVSIYCRSCSIKACVGEKKLQYCFQCRLFPCKKLLDFKNDQHPHHSIVFRNLELIKNLGAKQWLEEQERRWQCQGCNNPFSWYDDHCSSCGNIVKNSVIEEKEVQS